ncbi:CopD family protein [Sphingomonas sp. ID1715]|uniref:CopD family protein n=1 Tax=Sphingomonas sp. ID1715 TaxID=1656898 RepID=UPI0014889112|nr:CopD family protein [Sphingomonas sp. ID1715]NNM77288.1 CopD family protein [Sphingomonas sp. ID1715]
MAGMLGVAYDWIKAAHIVFVIFWMAGLFIFPRYLVHHQGALARPAEAKEWVEREAKLRKMILTPSIGVTWVLGLLLASSGDWWSFEWLHVKLLFVLFLSGFHGWAVAYSKRLALGEARWTSRQLRMLNEVPALAIVIIVFLVVLKPF